MEGVTKAREKRWIGDNTKNVDETQSDTIRKLAFVTILCAKLRNNVKFEPQDGTTKLHTFTTMFNMCVLQEDADDPTFFLSRGCSILTNSICPCTILPNRLCPVPPSPLY